MSAAARKISQPQMRLLWALARDHGYDGDGLRDLVEAVTGGRSISGLSRRQASRVIDRLSPNKAKPRKADPGNPPGADRRDLRKIQALWAELGKRGWYAPENRQKALRGFLSKRFGVSDPRFLTVHRARQVIEALKNILERMQ